MAQASVEVLRTHTPANRAESAFSDMARMARPYGERVKNTASAATMSGATINESTVSPWKGKPPTVKLTCRGTG